MFEIGEVVEVSLSWTSGGGDFWVPGRVVAKKGSTYTVEIRWVAPLADKPETRRMDGIPESDLRRRDAVAESLGHSSTETTKRFVKKDD